MVFTFALHLTSGEERPKSVCLMVTECATPSVNIEPHSYLVDSKEELLAFLTKTGGEMWDVMVEGEAKRAAGKS